jgi:hypothetical protein
MSLNSRRLFIFLLTIVFYAISVYFAPIEKGEFIRGSTDASIIRIIVHFFLFFFGYLGSYFRTGQYGIYDGIGFYAGLLVHALIFFLACRILLKNSI